MRIVRILLSLILITLLGDVSADEIEDKYLSDLSELTNNLFCRDKETIKYIDKDYKECISYVELMSKKCKLYAKYVTPDFNDYDHAKENERKIQYIAILYFSCVKAEIFQDKEGVILLN